MRMKYAPPSFARIVRSLNEISKTMMRNTRFFSFINTDVLRLWLYWRFNRQSFIASHWWPRHTSATKVCSLRKQHYCGPAYRNYLILSVYFNIWISKIISCQFESQSIHWLWVKSISFVFQLFSDALILVGHFRRCQPINKVHTKIVIDITVNITEAYRRDGGVVVLEAFSSLAALKVFTMKISSAAAGASWRWDDGVCVSANNLWALDEITHIDT